MHLILQNCYHWVFFFFFFFPLFYLPGKQSLNVVYNTELIPDAIVVCDYYRNSIHSDLTLSQLAAHLFAETTFGSFGSKVSSPVLPRVFGMLKEHTMLSFDLNSGGLTLILPILKLVLMSHDTKAVSHDFKGTGMEVLTTAVEKHLKALNGKVR